MNIFIASGLLIGGQFKNVTWEWFCLVTRFKAILKVLLWVEQNFYISTKKRPEIV